MSRHPKSSSSDSSSEMPIPLPRDPPPQSNLQALSSKRPQENRDNYELLKTTQLKQHAKFPNSSSMQSGFVRSNTQRSLEVRGNYQSIYDNNSNDSNNSIADRRRAPKIDPINSSSNNEQQGNSQKTPCTPISAREIPKCSPEAKLITKFREVHIDNQPSSPANSSPKTPDTKKSPRLGYATDTDRQNMLRMFRDKENFNSFHEVISRGGGSRSDKLFCKSGGLHSQRTFTISQDSRQNVTTESERSSNESDQSHLRKRNNEDGDYDRGNNENDAGNKPMIQMLKTVLFEEVQAEMDKRQYKSADNYLAQLPRKLANRIREKIKINQDEKYVGYKYITHVFASHRQDNLKMGVRCFWDPQEDLYYSYVYADEEIYCIASIFAIKC